MSEQSNESACDQSSEPASATDYHAVLVYDGECPFCSAAATALRRVEGVGAIAWGDEPAQAFLAAQFGEPPFALAFDDLAASARHTATVNRQ